ncbi:RNA polymerase sigma factor [Nannocystis pusilla]|uniref:RNA polymerase sigma factor n=1 Tax=Nannocystis pusilla TaxID=889268 RepID=UPI003B80A7B5
MCGESPGAWGSPPTPPRTSPRRCSSACITDFTHSAPGSMRAWLFGITRNLVLHDKRSYARRERHLAALPQPQETAREPDATVRVQQAAALMQAFLDELDLDKRLVFQMTEIEEMTADEIAEALAIPLGTVYSRLRAARARLERFRLRLHARDERRHACATNP